MRLPYIMTLAIAALALASCGKGDPNRLTLRGNLIAIDGDTFYVSGQREHYRLARIDAPEMPDHPCQGYRVKHDSCATGDPFVAKQALQHQLDVAPTLWCRRLKRDVYGRSIVECNGTFIGSPNISDELLAEGVVQEYRR